MLNILFTKVNIQSNKHDFKFYISIPVYTDKKQKHN